jgi:protein-tyrosine phosphatase
VGRTRRARFGWWLKFIANQEEECPTQHQTKLRRLTEFCTRHDSPIVPDPYYGGKQGFDHVLDLVEDACDGLMRHVKNQIQ